MARVGENIEEFERVIDDIKKLDENLIKKFNFDVFLNFSEFFKSNKDAISNLDFYDKDFFKEFSFHLKRCVGRISLDGTKDFYVQYCHAIYNLSLFCFELSFNFQSTYIDNVVWVFKRGGFIPEDVKSEMSKEAYGYQGLLASYEMNFQKLTIHNLTQRKLRQEHEIEDRTKKIKEQIESCIETKREAERLKEYLDKVNHGYNFTALSKAFINLKNDKSKKISGIKVFMASTILVIPLLFVCSTIFGFFFFKNKVFEHSDWVYILISFLLFVTSIISVSLYFYRVQLQEYRSINAQISQLELRIALCSFIENYADFKRKIKDTAEKSILEKFDNVIFSGLVLDETQVPTAYDGLAPLINAISKIIPKKTE